MHVFVSLIFDVTTCIVVASHAYITAGYIT